MLWAEGISIKMGGIDAILYMLRHLGSGRALAMPEHEEPLSCGEAALARPSLMEA